MESLGDAGRLMKGKPTATVQAKGAQAGTGTGSSSGSKSYGPKGRALPPTSTDAVLWSKGGASVGAAAGVRSKGVPIAGGASAANPPGYSQVCRLLVIGSLCVKLKWYSWGVWHEPAFAALPCVGCLHWHSWFTRLCVACADDRSCRGWNKAARLIHTCSMRSDCSQRSPIHHKDHATLVTHASSAGRTVPFIVRGM